VRPIPFKNDRPDADPDQAVIALTTFEGLLTLENGLATAATLSLGDDNTLELRAGGIKLGSWPASEWTIFPNGAGYSIRVEAETLTFVPNDRDAFRARMTEAIETTVETLVGTIDTPLKSVAELVEAAAPADASQAADAQADAPPADEEPTIADQAVSAAEEEDEEEVGLDVRRLVAVGLGAAALIVVLVVSILALVSEEPPPAEPDLASPTTTVTAAPASIPTGSPTSSLVTTTTLPSETPSIFTMSPKGFVATWNSVARRFRVPVELPPSFADDLGVYEFSPYLSLEVAAADTVELIRFVGDPAGDPASDQIMLATLGVTISVVEPDLDARGRADLLAQLGLDVRDPILPGLLSSLERDGASYSLVFDDEADVLVFEVRPTG